MIYTIEVMNEIDLEPEVEAWLPGFERSE